MLSMQHEFDRRINTLRTRAVRYLADGKADAERYPDDVAALAACICRYAFRTDFDIAAARDLCGLSDNNIHTRFFHVLGHTPAKYLEQLRLGAAAHLLLDTTARVNLVARAVGYPRVETFTRRFKAHYGRPPGRWRATRSQRPDQASFRPQPAKRSPVWYSTHGAPTQRAQTEAR